MIHAKKAIILPVALALFLTPLPARLGFYRLLAEMIPELVGLLPCMAPSNDKWGYTFEEFYGNGPDADLTSQKKYRNRLWGQTALVTGANSGTGYEISLALARLGVSVTMACRNPGRCEAAAKSIRDDDIVKERAREDRKIFDVENVVKTITVDTSSLTSVRNFSAEFLNRMDDGEGNVRPLDMLFLNAGIPAPIDKNEPLPLSIDGIENVFATNVVGHHLMYKLLEPCIRNANAMRKVPPRIVLTSSSASYGSKYAYKVATDLDTLNSASAGFDLYCQSKLAQILWAKELTARLDGESKASSLDPNAIVYVNAAHPGAVATNIWNKTKLDKVTLGRILKGVTHWASQNLMWTSEEGALTLIFLGTALDRLQKDNVRGQYFHPQARLMRDHKFAKDNDKDAKDLQERLWNFLDDLVADFV